MPEPDLIALMRYLLPGFVAASIYYAFTSHVKPSAFERVVQALVFTIVVEAIVSVARAIGCPWTDTVAFQVAAAGTLGIIVSAIVNHDLVHRLSRRLGVTRETSHPSEWYSAFAEFKDSHVVLHLVDERRLYGWPTEWPSSPDRGHFRISEAEWLHDDDHAGVPHRVVEDGPSPTGHALLVQARDVNMVEFVKSDQPNSEQGQDGEGVQVATEPTSAPNGRKATAATSPATEEVLRRSVAGPAQVGSPTSTD